jgi:hypothetical protein
MPALKSIHQKIILFWDERDWPHFLNPLPRYIFALVACMLVPSTWLTGCAIPITYHDATTYKNLTDLKAEAVMLVETHPGVVL